MQNNNYTKEQEQWAKTGLKTGGELRKALSQPQPQDPQLLQDFRNNLNSILEALAEIREGQQRDPQMRPTLAMSWVGFKASIDGGVVLSENLQYFDMMLKAAEALMAQVTKVVDLLP